MTVPLMPPAMAVSLLAFIGMAAILALPMACEWLERRLDQRRQTPCERLDQEH